MTDQSGWRGWDAVTPPSSTNPAARRRRFGAAAGLLGAGVVAGAILGGTLSATAASPSPSTGTAQTAPGYDGDGHGSGHSGALDQSGTVTAVGSSSVTIKTASGTTEYAVTSSSDIDKNGEAQLTDLKVGDAVTFSAETVGGKATIDKLHSGDETLNMPQGRPDSSAGGTTAG
ncbi:hypothetical protein [Frankia sp. Cppng1_Ct_nod]|uniref:hypothetical protein n=1 Tax=Frankia sp. Cppng1_Ct_nod TaxID=2897162 RepID=UPI001041A7D6|nr:hypothetical protein [Frankia sp. Cppng1_Ct_nod]